MIGGPVDRLYERWQSLGAQLEFDKCMTGLVLDLVGSTTLSALSQSSFAVNDSVIGIKISDNVAS